MEPWITQKQIMRSSALEKGLVRLLFHSNRPSTENHSILTCSQYNVTLFTSARINVNFVFHFLLNCINSGANPQHQKVVYRTLLKMGCLYTRGVGVYITKGCVFQWLGTV